MPDPRDGAPPDRSVGRATHRHAAVVAGVLVVTAVVGWVSVHRAMQGGYAIGLWPSGIATAALVITPRRHWWAVLPLVATIVAGTMLAGDRPAASATGYAVGTVLGIVVAALVLGSADGGRPSLHTDSDLRRWLAAAFGASAVAGSAGALTSIVTGFGTPWLVGLAVGVAHASSQLCVLPVYAHLPTHGTTAHAGERLVQWLLLLVGVPLLLLPEAALPMAFLAIPVLAWGALRLMPLESVVQLAMVVLLAMVLTGLGLGPFADAPDRFGLPGDIRPVLLASFTAACALMVVPLLVRVGEYMGLADSAAAERDLVRGIVDGAKGVAIIATDETGAITLFNPGAEMLLGYAAEEVVGRRTPMLHSQAAVADKAAELGVEADFTAVGRALLEGEHDGTAMRFRRKDGVERLHSLTVSRVRDSHGRVTGYVSTSEDITEQTALEQTLRDSLAVERRAVEQLRELEDVQDQFVSTVSHELRTPTASIRGYLELMSDGLFGELNAEQLRAVGRMESSCDRLLVLVDDLLTLSRVAGDGVGMEKESFDLREAVGAAYTVCAPSWSERILDVALTLPNDPLEVRGNRGMVERVVVNVLGNAVKFTEDGGSVSVTVTALDGQATVVVTDTGIGIPDEEQSHLFTRFFRSSLAESKAIAGTGLGLSIAQAIVEQHGGSVAISSTVGVGTTVTVRLPDPPGMSNIQLSLEPAT